MQILSQIFYVVPHFFVYKYNRNANNENNLLIDIPFDYERRLNVNKTIIINKYKQL